ncbi:MAG: hypothetical protein V7K42_28300 [Nostoc sp.]
MMISLFRVAPELDLPREWFTKAIPNLRILTGTLSLVLSVAGSTTKFILDDREHPKCASLIYIGNYDLPRRIENESQRTHRRGAASRRGRTQREDDLKGFLRQFRIFLLNWDAPG